MKVPNVPHASRLRSAAVSWQQVSSGTKRRMRFVRRAASRRASKLFYNDSNGLLWHDGKSSRTWIQRSPVQSLALHLCAAWHPPEVKPYSNPDPAAPAWPSGLARCFGIAARKVSLVRILAPRSRYSPGSRKWRAAGSRPRQGLVWPLPRQALLKRANMHRYTAIPYAGAVCRRINPTAKGDFHRGETFPP